MRYFFLTVLILINSYAYADLAEEQAYERKKREFLDQIKKEESLSFERSQAQLKSGAFIVDDSHWCYAFYKGKMYGGSCTRGLEFLTLSAQEAGVESSYTITKKANDYWVLAFVRLVPSGQVQCEVHLNNGRVTFYEKTPNSPVRSTRCLSPKQALTGDCVIRNANTSNLE